MPMENQDSQNKRGKIVTFVDCGNVFIHNHNYLSYYNTAFLTKDKNKLIQVPPPPLVIRIRFDNVRCTCMYKDYSYMYKYRNDVI